MQERNNIHHHDHHHGHPHDLHHGIGDHTHGQSIIGGKIKKLRQRKRISQDTVSKLSDLSPNTVVMVGSGANSNSTIEALTRIAEALNIGNPVIGKMKQ